MLNLLKTQKTICLLGALTILQSCKNSIRAPSNTADDPEPFETQNPPLTTQGESKIPPVVAPNPRKPAEVNSQVNARVDSKVNPKVDPKTITKSSNQNSVKGLGNPMGPVTFGNKSKCGGASFYSDSLAGGETASGEPYNPNDMTAASLDVPLGQTVTVSSQSDPSKVIQVRITDRGPYVTGRIIDLSRVAFEKMAPLLAGVTKACVYWN